jgi:hypothetical protein
MRTHAARRTVGPLALIALLGLIGAAQADLFHHTVPISPAQETPPLAKGSSGSANVTIDTDANTLRYNITFSGLSSAESAAHIHGFSARGTPSGILHTLPPGSPKIGVWNFTEGQQASILAGLTYINIHSMNHGGGELRGQIDNLTLGVPSTSQWGIIVLAALMLITGFVFVLRRRGDTIA